MLIKLVENSQINPSKPNSQVNSQVTQPTFTFLKSTMKIEQCVKSIQSSEVHQSSPFDVCDCTWLHQHTLH